MYQQTKKMWQETAKLWHQAKPTYRPSKIEIARLEKYLKQVLKHFSQPRVLVLGVTPEIRDLLAKYRLPVTLIDNNPVMIKAVATLVKRKNPKEKTVQADWLKMPFANNSFELIMSDHPTSSIHYRDFGRFFKELKRVLVPQGYFIIDIHINAQLKKLTLDDYIETYRQNIKWWHNFDNQVLTQYQVIMGHSNYYKAETYRCLWGKLDRLLRQRYENGKLSRQEYQALTCKLGEINIYTFPPKSACDKVIKKYFRILRDSKISDHPVYQYYVPYFCQAI